MKHLTAEHKKDIGKANSIALTKYYKTHQGYWKSKKRPDISIGQMGNKNHSWKGDKVKYIALHQWLYKQVGQPKKCEHCGRTNLRPRQYSWANVSGKYKRNIKDWIRLCGNCHKKYDKKDSG